MTQRVRKYLAQRGDDGATFGELWEAVKKGGGTKFAIRSSLHKDREKGSVSFDGDRYRLVVKK